MKKNDTSERIVPALFDLQVNGYGGVEFASEQLTESAVRQVVSDMAQMGVARFCPTLTTASPDCLRHGLTVLASACRRDAQIAAAMPGFHLEGPYIASQDGPRGAHPLAWCHAPDHREFATFQEAAEGRIRIVTLSPEYDESPDFIRWLVKNRVRVAIGHTAASAAQIDTAVEAGATFSTHLGNGSHVLLPRLRNYLWTQLAEDRLAATIIADGFHLPVEVLRVFLRAKGVERVCLVSDLAAVAGQKPGVYESSLCRAELLKDGRLVVAGQREFLAGAATPLVQGVENLIQHLGLPWETAWQLASVRPAQIFFQDATIDTQKILDEQTYNRIQINENQRITILETILQGTSIFRIHQN
ncbi:MAG: N-acetylglucosamine-6-phosphate deacetylase [Thermoguttaceae bacterium]|nr:N-acetylglucosamine-6-phosphate deacetylase [Thermoguttaceae bacterium]